MAKYKDLRMCTIIIAVRRKTDFHKARELEQQVQRAQQAVMVARNLERKIRN